MLSCIIGLARMYQLTGNPEYRAVAENAWMDRVPRQFASQSM